MLVHVLGPRCAQSMCGTVFDDVDAQPELKSKFAAVTTQQQSREQVIDCICGAPIALDEDKMVSCVHCRRLQHSGIFFWWILYVDELISHALVCFFPEMSLESACDEHICPSCAVEVCH